MTTLVTGGRGYVGRHLLNLIADGVDTIVRTAAQSHPELSIDVPLTTIAANIGGTAAVLEPARHAGVRRVVNLSSECALGNHPPGTVVTEDAVPDPTTPLFRAGFIEAPDPDAGVAENEHSVVKRTLRRNGSGRHPDRDRRSRVVPAVGLSDRSS